jgi:hypothetical protein
MVKDETHDRLTSTVSFWSSIGFYSLCSSSMLLVLYVLYRWRHCRVRLIKAPVFVEFLAYSAG